MTIFSHYTPWQAALLALQLVMSLMIVNEMAKDRQPPQATAKQSPAKPTLSTQMQTEAQLKKSRCVA